MALTYYIVRYIVIAVNRPVNIFIWISNSAIENNPFCLNEFGLLSRVDRIVVMKFSIFLSVFPFLFSFFLSYLVLISKLNIVLRFKKVLW